MIRCCAPFVSILGVLSIVECSPPDDENRWMAHDEVAAPEIPQEVPDESEPPDMSVKRTAGSQTGAAGQITWSAYEE